MILGQWALRKLHIIINSTKNDCLILLLEGQSSCSSIQEGFGTQVGKPDT